MIAEKEKIIYPLPDGTVYSKRKNFRPFSTPTPQDYAPIVGEEKIDRLLAVASRLKGLKLFELNATAQGGGVAEILYSAVPFLNHLGIDAEWKIIGGNKDYFECTKCIHNLLQGMEGSFTPEMERAYLSNLETCAGAHLIDWHPEVVTVHDPQPLCLARYIKKPEEAWLWRCHIDIEEAALKENQPLWDLIKYNIEHYDAAIFSAAHYIVSRWPLPKFIIPPFIDPLSEKNRDLSQDEIERILHKYQIDPGIPIIAQIGRFDPWKGIDRTIATYREVRKERPCQLILAGGLASDDPEGEKVLAEVCEETKNDGDIHVLNLSLVNRRENWMEVNALQRAARVIMQPSTREGFGLVITEALWKGKPIITANVGGIPLQVRDGDTGYFYQEPKETAQKVVYLLDHPEAARLMGDRGKSYVREHFLLPDRIVDYLMAIEMTRRGTLDKETCTECIISFHPWFKLSKR